jgi:NitT/TauT family transport system permease protein
MSTVKSVIIKIISLFLIVSFYQLSRALFHVSFLPSIRDILLEMMKITHNGEFFGAAGITLRRTLISLVFVSSTTIIIGLIRGLSDFGDRFLSIPISFFRTIPGLIWTMITFIWFGFGENAIYVSVVLARMPFLNEFISDGVKGLDLRFIDVGRVYRFSIRKKLLYIIFPQILPQLFSLFKSGLTFCWRFVVVAELFGVSDGVGNRINLAYQMFNSKGVFAWTICFALLIICIEYLILDKIEKILTIWRK